GPGKSMLYCFPRESAALVRAGDIKLKSVQGIGVNDDISCRIDCRNDRRGLRLVAQQVSDNRVTGFVICRGFDLRFASLCHWLQRQTLRPSLAAQLGLSLPMHNEKCDCAKAREAE